MKRSRRRIASGSPVTPQANDRSGALSNQTKGHRSRWWRRIGLFLLVVILIGAAGRAMLPWLVRDYVNRTLDTSLLYAGKIGGIEIHLWRGAYSVQDIRLDKRTANVPVPLFAAKRVDFSIQWKALLHRRLVAWVNLEEPELNFVDVPGEGQGQTGSGGPWLQIIQDLFPFKINRAMINHGVIHFRLYQTKTPVDVYLSDVQIAIDNLGNVRDETAPLFSTVQATALAMDHAKVECKMTFDPFAYRPTFSLTARILGLDVTTINDLAKAYGKFDFERGWFDFVVEADAKEGQLAGYAKPLFRNLRIFRLKSDNENPLELFWQALVGAATHLLKNQPRDQFGTLIPFEGDLSGSTSADILATIANVLHNAFVRAYLPSLEPGQNSIGFLNFKAPEFTDMLSVGAAP